MWLFLSIACNLPTIAGSSSPPNPSSFNLATLDALTTPIHTQTANVPPTPVVTELTAILTLPALTATSAPPPADSPIYLAQSGDTLDALTKRFGVSLDQVTSDQAIPPHGLIAPGQTLVIPNLIGSPPYPDPVLPDSEVIDSPSASGFNLQDYVDQAVGYLSSYHQTIGTEHLDGAQIVQRVIDQTSINPRLLLALLEFRSHWVTNPNPPGLSLASPMGYNIPEYQGLFAELSLTAKLLNMGYYGWRQGSLTSLVFTDGQIARLAPRLNAGSVALQYLFARLYPSSIWQDVLYSKDGFIPQYVAMFGDPWARAAKIEPLFPAGLVPLDLELPFASGEEWAFTGGPHEDWNTGTPDGALDFAPITGETHCAVSSAWARAAAPGLVIGSSPGLVLLALDGTESQPSGWVLVYYHMADRDRVAAGAHLKSGDPIGHPSCEGGDTTGANLHLARRYRGEWIGAGDPLPLVLSGWTANPGEKPYQGTLVKDNKVVIADPNASKSSRISW